MKCNQCQKDVLFYKKHCPHCNFEMNHFWIRLISSTISFLKIIMRHTKKVILYIYTRMIFYYKKLLPHLKVFFSVKRNRYITASILAVLVMILVIAGLTGGKSKELSVDQSGGTIVVATKGPLKDMTIEVPIGAYDEIVKFEVTYETFMMTQEPELFEAITPLIHIDNDSIFSIIPLTITIPISIDTAKEFAMAFYFDEVTNAFEAIPILTLNNQEIVIATSHFSSIVVSKVSHKKLLDEVLMYPHQYDTGFQVGIDDFPFNNYGSEISKDGHCAGQALAMSWYYTEKRLKENEPPLFTRFNNNTPNYWEDDVFAYRFASIIQESYDFDSEAFSSYIDMLNQDDSIRFFSFAYALYMTKRPQLLAIYTLDKDKELENGHAIMVYKLVFNVNRFELYLADPNFSGDASRFITYSEQVGFGTYYSGLNADDIENDKGITYTEFAHMGQSSLVDYKLIEKEFDKVLDGTIGVGKFSSVSIEYAYQYENNIFNFKPLTQDTVYDGFAVEGKLQKNQILLRFTSQLSAFNIDLIKGFEKLDNKYTTSGEKVTMTVPLDIGKNEIGLLYYSLYREDLTNKYFLAYNSYYAYNITLNIDEIYDVEQMRSETPGQYIEIKRSSGVDPNYPILEINLAEPSGDMRAVTYFDTTSHTQVTGGYWYVSDSVRGYESGTMVLYIDEFFDEKFFVMDPYSKTFTYTFTDGEYIIYQKKLEPTYEYQFFHWVALVNTYSNVYEYVYEVIAGPLYYDQQWKIDMMNPDGYRGQIGFQLQTNIPYMKVVITNPKYTTPFSRQVIGGVAEYQFQIDDGEKFVIEYEIFIWENGEWIKVYVKTISVEANFKKD